MGPGKSEYLRQLTATLPMFSAEVGREMEGSTPPSVFVGAWNYPAVDAGPMMSGIHGDTRVMDTPEEWIPGGKTQEQIIGYRMGLVRGKRRVRVDDRDSRFAELLREIALSDGSVESEAAFGSVPQGYSLSEDHAPFGPSAPVERFEIGNVRWDRNLEQAFHDTDLTATGAMIDLHRKGVSFSSIQKALSAGALGMGQHRRLVPTRWSITACDTAIGNHLLSRVRQHPLLDTVRVHEFSSLHNTYAVILLPTPWQYEWMEAFLQVMGKEELLFADHEGFRPKKEYSSVGGCFYSCRMAVLEALAREGRQAGAIILREAYRGYIPLGVFNVRENVRQAMLRGGTEFEDLGSALTALAPRLALPMDRFLSESTLLADLRRGTGQKTLGDFTAGAS
jgi:DNA repair protein NreA